MKAIVITYHNGYQVVRFKDDPDTLDVLTGEFDHIEDVQEVDFEGIYPNPERKIREMIRKLGKEKTRKILENYLEEMADKK